MKGFIEVTVPYLMTINVNEIIKFYQRAEMCEIYLSNGHCISTLETYEEIKQLIKQSTEL